MLGVDDFYSWPDILIISFEIIQINERIHHVGTLLPHSFVTSILPHLMMTMVKYQSLKLTPPCGYGIQKLGQKNSTIEIQYFPSIGLYQVQTRDPSLHSRAYKPASGFGSIAIIVCSSDHWGRCRIHREFLKNVWVQEIVLPMIIFSEATN